MDIKIAIVFLYTSNKKLERVIKRQMPFTVVSKILIT